jgi:hypothetical protein
MAGCCADKACKQETCMKLPPGVTCATCAHFQRCVAIFGCKADGNVCDWFPRRYRAAPPLARAGGGGGVS